MSTTENSRQFQSRAGDKKEREAHWVPCDQLRVCGKAPSTVGATVNPTGGNRYLTLEYEDLPFGCNINAEVVAVDTAGNRSSVETPTFVIRNENPSDPYGHLAANRITVTQSSLRFSTWFNEVYYPTCGNSGPDYVPGLGVLCENEDNLGNIGNHYYTCRTTNHFNSGVSGYRSSYRAGKPAFHNRCCDGEGCRPWN